MSFLVKNLEVDALLLSEIEAQNILDAKSVAEILVSPN